MLGFARDRAIFNMPKSGKPDAGLHADAISCRGLLRYRPQ